MSFATVYNSMLTVGGAHNNAPSTFSKQADYLTSLSDHSFDDIYEGAYDSSTKAYDYNKIYNNTNKFLQKTWDRAADRTDYDSTAEVDNPNKVKEIVLGIINRDPMTWAQWQQAYQKALAENNTAELDVLADNLYKLYVRTDKPGIAGDRWNLPEPDKLTAMVNTAYGNNPTTAIARLLSKYRQRYSAYQAAGDAVAKANEKYRATLGITKQADYIDSIPYSEQTDMDWAAERSVPEVDILDDAWDARNDKVKRTYSQALVNKVTDIVKRIQSGDYSYGEAGTGASETGTNPQVYMPIVNYDNYQEQPFTYMPYADWKATLEQAIKDPNADPSKYNVHDGFYVKTDGTRLNNGSDSIRSRDAAKAIYGKNIPTQIATQLQQQEAAYKQLQDAEARQARAKKVLAALFKSKRNYL